MTEERKDIVINNLLSCILDLVAGNNPAEYVKVLREYGLTDEEIAEDLRNSNLDDKEISCLMNKKLYHT